MPDPNFSSLRIPKLLGLAIGLSLVAATTCTDASTDGRECIRVEGAEPLLAPGAVVMVGEVHGTSTIPASFRELVCQAVTDGLSMTVALEINRSEEERIRRYLESAGSDADRSELIEGPFWQSSYQDGRRSLAMVDLLSGLREMIAEGRELDVVLLDREEFPSAQARDAFMADTTCAHRLFGVDIVVTALHTRSCPPAGALRCPPPAPFPASSNG